MLELPDLTLLPLRDVNRSPAARRRVARERQRGRNAQQPGELLQRLPGSGARGIVLRAVDEVLRLKPRLRQPVDAIEFRLDAFEEGVFRVPLLPGDIRHDAVFDNQASRRNQGGQFGVAEFPQQSPDVAIDGLGPDVLP